jgi:hypothetical protein
MTTKLGEPEAEPRNKSSAEEWFALKMGEALAQTARRKAGRMTTKLGEPEAEPRN